MNLIDRLRAAKAEKAQTAREQYFVAMRTGKPAATLLEMAEAAEIPPEQYESDAATLEEAARLRPLAEKLPMMQQASADAKRTAEAAQKALDDAVAKLQPLALAAWARLNAAIAEEQACAKEVRALASLIASNPELMPADTAPAIVKKFRADADADDTADAAKRASHQRWLAAKERAESAKAALARVGAPATFMGKRTSLSGPHPIVADELEKAARAEVAAAESELNEAIAAMDAEQ